MAERINFKSAVLLKSDFWGRRKTQRAIKTAKGKSHLAQISAAQYRCWRVRILAIMNPETGMKNSMSCLNSLFIISRICMGLVFVLNDNIWAEGSCFNHKPKVIKSKGSRHRLVCGAWHRRCLLVNQITQTAVIITKFHRHGVYGGSRSRRVF